MYWKRGHHTSGERVPGRHSPAAQNSQDLEDDELKHGAGERERHGEDHLHNVLPHLLKSDAKPVISFPDILNAESSNGKSENLCWILQSEAETWVTQSSGQHLGIMAASYQNLLAVGEFKAQRTKCLGHKQHLDAWCQWQKGKRSARMVKVNSSSTLLSSHRL